MKEGGEDQLYDKDDSTQEPPTDAPLGFGWDALILLLLIATAYALYIHKHKVLIH